MLGASDDIPVNVTVKNSGESAYETQLFISHPATVPYNRIETQVINLSKNLYYFCAKELCNLVPLKKYIFT